LSQPSPLREQCVEERADCLDTLDDDIRYAPYDVRQSDRVLEQRKRDERDTEPHEASLDLWWKVHLMPPPLKEV